MECTASHRPHAPYPPPPYITDLKSIFGTTLSATIHALFIYFVHATDVPVYPQTACYLNLIN